MTEIADRRHTYETLSELRSKTQRLSAVRSTARRSEVEDTGRLIVIGLDRSETLLPPELAVTESGLEAEVTLPLVTAELLSNCP